MKTYFKTLLTNNKFIFSELTCPQISFPIHLDVKFQIHYRDEMLFNQNKSYYRVHKDRF